MSNSRRHLVSRARLNNGASQSPAPNSQARASHASAQLNTELPPYQPPECQLVGSQKVALSSLKTNHDFRKYQRHLKAAMSSVTDAASSTNDRLYERHAEIEKAAERRAKQGKAEDGLTEEETEQRRNHGVFTRKAAEVTRDAEKALRELIDFDDEQKMHAHHIELVYEAIANAPPPRNRDDEDEEEDDVEIISPAELFKKTKADYMTGYTSKSMMDRYGDHNEYKNFKRVLHDAMNPGDDAPELPRANTWFPEDKAKSGSRRRRGNTTDHASNGYESDSSIEIERATVNLKCPISIQYFEEPITSTCNHTFNKEHFEEYFRNTVGDRGPRGKTVKCPTTGCNQDLTMEDFHLDQVKMRQVERQKKKEARENASSDEEDEAPRGGQRNPPQELGDDDDEDDEDAATQAHRSRVKSERAKSRGPNSSVPNPRGDISEDSDEEMEG